MFKIFLFMLFFNGLTAAMATPITVNVETVDGQPATNVVVYLVPTDNQNLPEPPTAQSPAVMDQINQQFVPHILVVQRNTQVAFPNSDSIKHHVYSFSKAKPFELKLYSDNHPDPIPFDKAGEVVMGCNIHDWMLGYIYVVDTPWFSKTNRQGFIELDVPAGQYELKIWSPLLQGSDRELSQVVDHTDTTQLRLQLSSPLLPALNDYELDDEIEQY